MQYILCKGSIVLTPSYAQEQMLVILNFTYSIQPI